MKKLFSIVLILFLLLNIMSAQAEHKLKRDYKLDTFFQNDTLSAHETKLGFPSSDNIEMNEEAAEKASVLVEGDVHEAMEKACADNDYNYLSSSPSGYAAFIMVGKIPVAMNNFKYHVIYPSSSRGVKDTYSKMQDCYQDQFGFAERNIGEHGVIYSRDDKYAVIYDDSFAYGGAFLQDPMIVDLTTGELIHAATYERDSEVETAATVASACFSYNNRFLYYVMYFNIQDIHNTEDRYVLYRFNLDTEISERCCSIPYSILGSRMFACEDGTLFIIGDSFNTEYGGYGLIRITKNDRKWKVVQEPIHYFSGKCFSYSDNSGYATLHAAQEYEGFKFGLFQPDDADTYDECYAIEMETNQVIRRSTDSDRFIQSDCYKLIKIQLSPDGFYAMAFVWGKHRHQDRHLFMINLENLTCKEINGIDLSGSALFYKPILDWTVDGLFMWGKQSPRFVKFDD